MLIIEIAVIIIIYIITYKGFTGDGYPPFTSSILAVLLTFVSIAIMAIGFKLIKKR